jgi:hypothetical protein
VKKQGFLFTDHCLNIAEARMSDVCFSVLDHQRLTVGKRSCLRVRGGGGAKCMADGFCEKPTFYSSWRNGGDAAGRR